MRIVRICALLRRSVTIQILLWLFAGISSGMAQDVIANMNIADSTVSKTSLRAIFSMRMRQWPNGLPIKVYVLPAENPVHISFSKGLLNTFPHQLKRSWDILVYSGTGQAPTEVESPQEMLQKVASTPGAIGYMPENYVIKGDINEKIHIMEVR